MCEQLTTDIKPNQVRVFCQGIILTFHLILTIFHSKASKNLPQSINWRSESTQEQKFRGLYSVTLCSIRFINLWSTLWIKLTALVLMNTWQVSSKWLVLWLNYVSCLLWKQNMKNLMKWPWGVLLSIKRHSAKRQFLTKMHKMKITTKIYSKCTKTHAKNCCNKKDKRYQLKILMTNSIKTCAKELLSRWRK